MRAPQAWFLVVLPSSPPHVAPSSSTTRAWRPESLAPTDVDAFANPFKRVLDADPQHAGATRGMRQLQRKVEEAEKKGSGLGKFLKR